MRNSVFNGATYQNFIPVFQEYQNKPLPIAQDSSTIVPQQLQAWPVSARYNPIVQTFVSRVRQLPAIAEVWAKVEIDAIWLVVVTDVEDLEQARQLYEIRAGVVHDFEDTPVVFYHADARYMPSEHIQAEIPEDAERVYAR